MSKKMTLLAFTDASSYNGGHYPDPDDDEYSCSAGVLTFDDNILYSFTNYNPGTSISYGELYAIYCLLSDIVPLLEGTNHELILFTDSDYAFKSLTEYYKTWKMRSINGIWYGSSGEVAYQELIKETLSLIKRGNVTLRRVSGGHLNVLEEGYKRKKSYYNSLVTLFKRYKRDNKVSINKDQAAYLIFYNNICDQMAKFGLEMGRRGLFENERKRKTFKKYISVTD